VYALRMDGSGWRISRRDSLKMGATAAVAAGAGSGCHVRTAQENGETEIQCENVFAHAEYVASPAVTPDGKTLASGDDEGTIRLWSLPDGGLMKVVDGHESCVRALAVPPDGGTLFSGSDDGTVKLWSLPDGSLQKELAGYGRGSGGIAVSPDGKTVASAGWRAINLWALPAGDLLRTLEGHTDTVHALAITPDGATLISAGGDRTVRLWSLPDGKPRIRLMDLDVSPENAKGMRYRARTRKVSGHPHAPVRGAHPGRCNVRVQLRARGTALDWNRPRRCRR